MKCYITIESRILCSNLSELNIIEEVAYGYTHEVSIIEQHEEYLVLAITYIEDEDEGDVLDFILNLQRYLLVMNITDYTFTYKGKEFSLFE